MRTAACKVLAAVGVAVGAMTLIVILQTTQSSIPTPKLTAPSLPTLPSQIEPPPAVGDIAMRAPKWVALALPEAPAEIPVSEPEALTLALSWLEPKVAREVVALSCAVGDRFTVRPRMDEPKWRQLDPSERKQRLADAVALGIVYASDMGDKAMQNALETVLAAPPDSPRVVMLPKKRAALIVPKGASINSLGAIADDARLEIDDYVGVVVYTWESSANAMAAIVTRVDVPVEKLFSAEYGYHEAVVDTPERARLFAEVVTHVTWTDGAFRFGGRAGSHRPKHWMAVEPAIKVARTVVLERRRAEALRKWDERVNTLLTTRSATDLGTLSDMLSRLQQAREQPDRSMWPPEPRVRNPWTRRTGTTSFDKRIAEIRDEIRKGSAFDDPDEPAHKRIEKWKSLLETRAQALKAFDEERRHIDEIDAQMYAAWLRVSPRGVGNPQDSLR